MIIQGRSRLEDFVAEITSTRPSVYRVQFGIFLFNSIRIRMLMNTEIKIGFIREDLWANLTRVNLLNQKYSNEKTSEELLFIFGTVSGCWPLR